MNASTHRKSALLATITAVVLFAHWSVLYGLPLNLGTGAGPDNSPAPAVRAFTTRTIDEQRYQPVPPAEPAPAVPTPKNEPKAAAGPVQSAQATIIPIAQIEQSPAPSAVHAPTPLASAETPKMPAAAAPDAQAIQAFAFPGPVSLSYDVRGEEKGFAYSVSGKLDWQHDGVNYNARMEISHFLLGARVQTSKGTLTPEGLAPVRFGDKFRSEVAAHFERAKGKVTFSANTPEVPLLPGAQDQLSAFVQLASMLGGDPSRFAPGTQVAFQAVGPRSAARWVFRIGTLETLKLPGGIQQAIHVTRDPVNEYEPRAEAWLSPDMGFLPVRIRLSQTNGDFVEQQWKSTKYPQ